MFFQYMGNCVSMKLPANAAGSPSPISSGQPDIQCFLVWPSIANGDVVEIDEEAYPFCVEYMNTQHILSGDPLWVEVSGPATVLPPQVHRPSLTRARI